MIASRRFVGSSLLALGVAAGDGLAQPLVWEIGQGGNGHAYEFVPSQGIQWADASAAANSMSYLGQPGHLATLGSDGENGFIAGLLAGVDEAWLGGQQLDPDDPPEAGWSWVTGEGWSYTNWSPGEPNDAGGDEHYLGMWGSNGQFPGQWNDECDMCGVTGFVVEYGAAACYADCDGSGDLSLFDFLCFVNLFNAGGDEADCDGSGVLDLFDFLCFTNEFNAGC